MAVNIDIPTEVEVFGVNYERYALQKLFKKLKKKLQLNSVIEMPASGVKAMPSLYSLGFALAGCDVTLVDADQEGLRIWQELGLDSRLTNLTRNQLDDQLKEGRRWDLCWNFMVIPAQDDPRLLIRRMKECSQGYLMLINVNRFNIGFTMHRTVHRLWKIEWTHGDLRFFSPLKTAQFLRKLGIKSTHWGVVDCPPWPDSLGFRDLRLHRLGDQAKKWVCPYADYLKKDQFPSWMKWVYFCEWIPIPSLMKLPYAHLFYIYGRVDHETT